METREKEGNHDEDENIGIRKGKGGGNGSVNRLNYCAKRGNIIMILILITLLPIFFNEIFKMEGKY